MWVTILFLISFASLGGPVSPAYGSNLQAEHIELYTQLAILNSNGVTRKIDKTGPITIQGVCEASPSRKCNKSILNRQINDAFRPNPRIKKKVVRENADFRFVHTGSVDLEKKKRDLSTQYESGFSDSSDLDCQLYYSIEGNVIRDVVIIVSLDSAKQKQRFCVASQILQGLGLSLPNGSNFAQLWKDPSGGTYAFDDKFITQMTGGYGILGYIHMCPDIHPGMKAPAIRSLLDRDSTCLDGLRNIPGLK